MSSWSASFSADEPCLLFKLLDEAVQDVSGGGVLFVNLIVDLTHSAGHGLD